VAQTIAIIDYGSGNLHSAAKAFEHVVEECGIDARVIVTDKASAVKTADRIVLPGQGAFGQCMNALKDADGMVETLEETVLHGKKPFFGVCVGMQLLADMGHEHGRHEGLGWIPGEVVPMQPIDPALKIPHMGWNDTLLTEAGRNFPMLQGVTNNHEASPIHFYFVHSFMVECKYPEHKLAVTDYGGEVTAIIGRDNIMGAQFHPEKSQKDGLALIESFLRWTS
jgi:glutamine amidotransferase